MCYTEIEEALNRAAMSHEIFSYKNFIDEITITKQFIISQYQRSSEITVL